MICNQALGCGQKYDTVYNSVQALCDDNKLGDMLWSFAVLKVLNQAVADKINEGVSAFAATDMTLDAINTAKFTIEALVREIPGIAKLPRMRDVEIKYEGDLIPAKVSSIQAQVNVSISSAWKGAALAKNLIKSFFCEDTWGGHAPRQHVAHSRMTFNVTC